MDETKPIKMPDITTAQIVAVIQPFVTSTIGLLVAFNVNITQSQQVAISGFVIAVSGLISAALLVADAVIRNGRSRLLTAVPPPPTRVEEKVSA